MSTLQRIGAISSWCLAALGALFSLVICFAAGMKTVPHLKWSEAFATLPLPVAAAIIAGLILLTARRRQVTRCDLFWTLPAFCLAALSFLLVALTLLTQPGR